MGLPVIVERNAWTLPQERYNALWVREKQVGLVVANFNYYCRGRQPPARKGDVRAVSMQCQEDAQPRFI